MVLSNQAHLAGFGANEGESEVSLYSARCRNYHPGLGRWIERDPEGYGDGMNLMQYASSNPVDKTDPSGLDTKDAIALVGLALGSVDIGINAAIGFVESAVVCVDEGGEGIPDEVTVGIPGRGVFTINTQPVKLVAAALSDFAKEDMKAREARIKDDVETLKVITDYLNTPPPPPDRPSGQIRALPEDAANEQLQRGDAVAAPRTSQNPPPAFVVGPASGQAGGVQGGNLGDPWFAFSGDLNNFIDCITNFSLSGAYEDCSINQTDGADAPD